VIPLSTSTKTSILSRYPNILIYFASVILATGCASSATSEYQILTITPTPQIWKEQPIWQFHIVDPDGSWLGSMDLMFGEEQVDTCTSGDWRKATLLRSSVKGFAMTGAAFTGSGGESDIAYEISGAFLWIDLHARICDSNIMLRGELLETGAIGKVRYSTPFPAKDDNGNRGTFTAAPLVAE
jgi:hypothetical protein